MEEESERTGCDDEKCLAKGRESFRGKMAFYKRNVRMWDEKEKLLRKSKKERSY